MKRLGISLFAGPVIHAPADTVLVLVPQDERPLRGEAGWLDWRLCGAISKQLLSGYVTGKLDEAVLIPTRAPLSGCKLLLLGVGGQADRAGSALEQIMRVASSRLLSLRSPETLLALPGAIDFEREIQSMMRGWLGGLEGEGPDGKLELVIPAAASREAALRAAVASLLPDAHEADVKIELGWHEPRDADYRTVMM